MKKSDEWFLIVRGAVIGIMAVALFGSILALTLKSFSAFLPEPLFRIEVVMPKQ